MVPPLWYSASLFTRMHSDLRQGEQKTSGTTCFPSTFRDMWKIRLPQLSTTLIAASSEMVRLIMPFATDRKHFLCYLMIASFDTGSKMALVWRTASWSTALIRTDQSKRKAMKWHIWACHNQMGRVAVSWKNYGLRRWLRLGGPCCLMTWGTRWERTAGTCSFTCTHILFTWTSPFPTAT